MFFFLFLRIVPGKVLAKRKGESQEHLMSNESRVSIYDYGFRTVTIRKNSNFKAGVPGLHSWENHVHCISIPPPMNNLYFQRV